MIIIAYGIHAQKLSCPILKLLLLLFAAVIGPGEATEPAFEVQLTRQGSIEQVAVQADGRIFISGSFDFVAGEPRRGLARLNQDGSLDGTFVPENEESPIAITLDDAGVDTTYASPNNQILETAGNIKTRH